MDGMKRVLLEHGDGHMAVEVPDHAVVVRPGELFTEPQAAEDPVALTREALANPLGCPPLRGMVGPGSRVTIAFPDRVKGGAHENSHRRLSLSMILDELLDAGVWETDIRAICAIGLHRKNYKEDFYSYLGADLTERLLRIGLVSHDAEDPAGMVRVGETDEGDVVELNRAALEADLTILIGHTVCNPYGGFSGGYKMPCTGLAGWRSIRCHHSPKSLYRPDFVPISTSSHFRHQLRKIGQVMEGQMKRPFFEVDAVLNGQARQMAVYAGTIPEVERASWPLAQSRTEISVPGEPADVLVIGIPRTFHYGPGMGTNPLLMKQAIGASIARASGALTEHPVVIAASVCDGWFNDEWFPAYREVYAHLQRCVSTADLVRYEDETCEKFDWIAPYRNAFAYHPFHAFSMAYMGGLADQYARAIYVVGPKEPAYARGMGCIPVDTFEKALNLSERHVGRSPRMIVVPALTQVQVHLRSEGRPGPEAQFR